MSRIYKRLKLAEEKRKKNVTLNLGDQHINEILEGSTKGSTDKTREELVEELLARGRRVRLKVKCPQCKGHISMRFRIKLKSRKNNASGQEVAGTS